MLSHTGDEEGEAKGKKGNEGQVEHANDLQTVRVAPVNGVEVFLQVFWVHVTLAQLQLGARIVVNVVNTHLLHYAEASLRKRRDLGAGRNRWTVQRADVGIRGGRDGGIKRKKVEFGGERWSKGRD